MVIRRRDSLGRPLPIVIRKVTKKDRRGDPKVASDRKRRVDVERVMARALRSCAGCPEPIVGVYAKMVDHQRADGPFIHGRNLPVPVDYHFACLPDFAQPLRRFLERAE